jgi:hypothetical protein
MISIKGGILMKEFLNLELTVVLIASLLALSSIVKNTFDFIKDLNREKSDEEKYFDRSTFKHRNYNKFNLEEDLEPLLFMVGIIANEYVEDNVLNYHEDKVDDNAIRIPPTEKEHQENIDNIAELILDMTSDDHLRHLTKYLDIERIKYFIRIFSKQTYTKLIEDALDIRKRSEEQRFQNMKQDKNKDKSIPKNVRDILDEYEIDVDSAKAEVLSYNIDKNKLKKMSETNPEKKFGRDILELQNYYKGR